jgi:2-polyprenyl-3-methyl-5-hydroxy-6-metoxy-1,4-benzoquinol methylase
MLGQYERAASDLFRSAFMDMDALASDVAAQVRSPDNVLEIGCGEGILTEHLAAIYPHAALTGIDICESPGRLYRGDAGRVRFLRASVADLASAEQGRYDLVVIADVIHHVPLEERLPLLTGALDFLAPSGTVIFKEWLRERSAICLASFLFERFITGDRVRYLRERELLALATSVFGAHSVRGQFHIAPWHCNVALVIKADPATTSPRAKSPAATS